MYIDAAADPQLTKTFYAVFFPFICHPSLCPSGSKPLFLIKPYRDCPVWLWSHSQQSPEAWHHSPLSPLAHCFNPREELFWIWMKTPCFQWAHCCGPNLSSERRVERGEEREWMEKRKNKLPNSNCDACRHLSLYFRLQSMVYCLKSYKLL